MNKRLHRIIFNALRKGFVAVAETAASEGKGACGETHVQASQGRGHGNSNAVFILTIGASLVLIAGLLSQGAVAQIVADPNAPGNQRPTILGTASGVAQVNIQTPSAAGVSRNTYSQFDVNSQGAILNNSRTNTTTQLGGYVQGNPWLATGSARVILNEVNSSAASQLRGFVEVAGQRAEVIIANPAGIAVNGGGFINASSVTLTTGTPVMNAGSLESYRVRGGSVSIDGAGLDTSSADYTTLLARAAQVNAGVWAKDLKVVTGANDISASSAANPVINAVANAAANTTERAPGFALDVAALGGMYANHIFLIGTEAGLGVRNSGVIGATAGDVVLGNDGMLTNSGSIYAKGNTTVTTQGSISNTGTGLIAAQGNTTLNANGVNGKVTSDSGATMAAGMDRAGAVGNSGSLAITANASASLNGKVASGADTSIAATAIDVNGATLTAQNATLSVTVQGINASKATIATTGTFTAQAQTTITTDGATVSAAQLNLAANDLTNVGGTLQHSGTGDMALVLHGNLDNTGGTIASNAQNMSLAAATLTNAANGSVLHAGAGKLALTASQLDGNDGTIVSNGALNLQGGTVNLQNATTNAQQITIEASSLANQGGRIVQASSTQPAANIAVSGALDNTGGFVGSNGAIQLSAGSVSNANGQITALQSLSLTSAGTVSNTNAGLIQSNGALTVQAANLDNTGATLSSAQSGITISTSGQTTNTAGTITAAGDVRLTSESLRNGSAGLIGANGGVTVYSDAIQNSGGQIVGVGEVSIAGKSGVSSAAARVDNTAGLVQSGATLLVNASELINIGTYTAPTSNATALGLVGNDVQLSVDILNNQGGEVLAGNNLTVSAAQSIDNSANASGPNSGQGGLLYAGKVLKVQDSALNNNPTAARSLQLSNTGGTLNAGTSNQLKAAGVSGDGQLLSQGELSLDVAGDFNNTGTVNANGNASITSSGTVNNSGTLSSGQTLLVAAVNLNNTDTGVLSGVESTNVTLSDTLNNRGLIDSGNDAGTSLTLITASTVNNIGNGRIYGDNLAIGANTLTNDAETVDGVTKTAVIASRNQLDLGVQTLNNNNSATILSLGDMAIGGALDASNRATGEAGTVTNSASTIQSVNGNVTINTAVLQNLNPTFSYAVVNGETSGEKTEYILTNGQTVQDSEVALNNGGLTGYTIAGGPVSPRGAVLLNIDPLATPANIAVYKSNDVVTTSTERVQISDTGGGHCGCNPIYQDQTVTTYTEPNDPGLWAYFGVAPPSSPSDTAAYVKLQSKIDDVRSQMFSHMFTVQSYNAYTEAIQQAVVSGGTPGTISSAGNITINASSSARNDNSRILAGGALEVNVTGGQLDNTSTNVTVQATKTGYKFNWECVNFEATSVCGVGYYNDPNWAHQFAPQARVHQFDQYSDTTVPVSNSIAPPQYTGTLPSSKPADAASGGGGVSASNVAGQAATPALTASSAQSANSANRIASTNPSFKLPNSSLYQINGSPTAHYLVQTDPAFTRYKTWLSSDYISSRLALDPNVTQKRLGDGFYEQQLIREQVAQLTGQRFLGNYTSDQQQYQALMDSGLTFAQTYNLRPGVALSAAQVALLTSDIVWLEQQTVNLPDGSTTQALVPRVYAAIRDGDLAPSGALLAGNTVSINTSGDVNNSGTIAGRKLVQIGANNITNQIGSISGGTVRLTAVQDINNIGGSIGADNNLLLNAGRDINVASTTQSSAGSAAGYTFSQTGVDRVATLYTRGPGILLASAGNNINLTAAQVSSGGDIQMSAGNNLNLSTVTTGRSDNFNASDPNNHFLSSSSKEVGSSITSSGNTTLQAGNTLQATAANVNAGGDLTVNARNIVLLAGSSKASSDSVMTNTSGDMISSTTTVTKESHASAKAQVNQLSGKNVTITAEQDLVSVGSKFAATGITNGAGTGNLTVEGKNSQTFYAAKDVTTSSKSVESTSSMFGGAINMGSSSSTDTRTQQVSIASQLESTNAINVRVGNSATFEGAELTAKTTTFTKTDPNKAGQVNLNGSIDTTQSAHTEKSDTMGVYQSQSGSGSTTQTLNLTKINGNVTFDNDLQVAVQLPKTVATSGEKANTSAAANATNATSQASVQAQINELAKQPGLEYLNQLSNNAAQANPTQWSQVQLAHDNWNYQSQGLTPAGAALLSIAVAAYAPGLSTGMAGSITGVAGTSAATAVNAGLIALQAQTAVAMVNNGGDIGKTLQQLGSDESIKNLLTVMATAGAVDALNTAFFKESETISVNGQTGAASSGSNSISASQTANNFEGNLLKNVTNNLAGATINAAINGKPLDEAALSSALTNALITAGMALGANAIGDARADGALNEFTQKVAHAVLGCAGGAAMVGNGSGCSAGALGAVIGEMTAEFATQSGMSKDSALALAKTFSAASGLLAGGGGENANAVNIANSTGTNAAENNCIFHKCYLLQPSNENGLEVKQKAGDRFYAQQSTIEALNNLGAAWKASGESSNIVITEISKEVGPTPGHQTHQDGIDVDIRPMRISGSGSVPYTSSNYDQPSTQKLVDLILAQNPKARILFNDPNIKGVTPFKGHDDHLHVELR